MVRSSDAVERWGQGWGSVCWQGQWDAQAKLAQPVGRVLPRNLMFSVWDPHLQRTDRFFSRSLVVVEVAVLQAGRARFWVRA